MRYYLGFDDTDTLGADRGTGKLARWFEGCLPDEVQLRGVVRQQLPCLPEIPFTSHNSAVCVIVDGPGDTQGISKLLADLAADHIARHFLVGSDPGLCVASHDAAATPRLLDFAQQCTRVVVTREAAHLATQSIHLSAHGGNGDGIIGAAAAVGLTAAGWYGRFIEWQGLRDLPGTITVEKLNTRGIRVVSLDRDAHIPAPADQVVTRGWVRPRLLGGEPVLWVRPSAADPNVWVNADNRKRHRHLFQNCAN